MCVTYASNYVLDDMFDRGQAEKVGYSICQFCCEPCSCTIISTIISIYFFIFEILCQFQVQFNSSSSNRRMKPSKHSGLGKG